MNRAGPPGEKKAAPLARSAARSLIPGSAEVGSCFQDINSIPARQSSLASVDEAAEILGLELPEYPLFADWRTLFASDKQVTYLANRGVEADLASRGHANLLIYALRERRSKGMPRFRDVIALHRQGVNHPEKLSWDEAAELIARIGQGGEHA